VFDAESNIRFESVPNEQIRLIKLRRTGHEFDHDPIWKPFAGADRDSTRRTAGVSDFLFGLQTFSFRGDKFCQNGSGPTGASRRGPLEARGGYEAKT
jgi:hypothetical protein